MHKTVGAWMAVMVLLSGSVSAQTAPQVASDRLIRSIAAESRLSPAKLPALAAAQPTKWQPRTRQRSGSSRKGALIGLAAGVAAATVYWTVSNCRYGSDSGTAMAAQCVAPTAAMIGGGWLIGRSLGK